MDRIKPSRVVQKDVSDSISRRPQLRARKTSAEESSRNLSTQNISDKSGSSDNVRNIDQVPPRITSRQERIEELKARARKAERPVVPSPRRPSISKPDAPSSRPSRRLATEELSASTGSLDSSAISSRSGGTRVPVGSRRRAPIQGHSASEGSLSGSKPHELVKESLRESPRESPRGSPKNDIPSPISVTPRASPNVSRRQEVISVFGDQIFRDNKPYKPIKDNFRSHLVRYMKKYLAELPTKVEKSEFLNEDGYYKWLDKLDENQQMDRRLFSIMISIVEHWDISYPLLSDEHIRKLQPKSVKKNLDLSTKMNIIVRVLQAKDLLSPKGKGRNCYAVIEYPKADGSLGRYQTSVKKNTLRPEWVEEVTLTVTDLSKPIMVSVFHLKDRANFLTGESEEFLGGVAVNMIKIISETVKTGFKVDWYQLNNSDHGDKFRKVQVQGQVKIEVEMAGITEESHEPSSDASASTDPEERKLNKVRGYQALLINHKVDLKKLYRHFVNVIVRMDLNVNRVSKESDIPWSISSSGDVVLREFSRVWVISDMVRKYQFLDCVFENYQKQQVHSRSLLVAYRSLHEAIWKKKSVWLPEYEKPKLFALMKAIEVEGTKQIKKYREYFPSEGSGKKARELISSSLKPIILVTRSIDKNQFFQEEIEHKLHANVDEETSLSDEESKFADLTPMIHELDYKNGMFSFTEKLRGLILERSNEGYIMFSELSRPVTDRNDVPCHLFKCFKLAQLMEEDLEKDIDLYRDAFMEEIDIVPIVANTYSKYLVLELENMVHAVKQVRNSRKLIGESNIVEGEETALKIPEKEEDLIAMAFDLMKIVHRLKKRCMKFCKEKVFPIDSSSVFSPFVFRWLETAESQALEWVQNAVKIDSFQPSNDHHYSSSVTDLLSAMFQSFDVLNKALEDWNDKAPVKIFVGRFAQVIFRAVYKYSEFMEQTGVDISALNAKSSVDLSNGNSSMQTTVMNWFGYGATPTGKSTSITEIPKDTAAEERLKKACVCLSNLRKLGNELRRIYKDMKGSELAKEAKAWRKEKASELRKKNPEVFVPRVVSGILRIHIFCAENLKARPGFISGKTNPYAVIEGPLNGDSSSQGEELARSRCSFGLYPVWTYANPILTVTGGESEGKFKFLMASAQYIVAVVDTSEMKLKVFHKKDNASFSFLTTDSSDPLLGEGTIQIDKDKLRESKEPFWVDLSPQGRVLIKIEWSVAGLPGIQRGKNDMNSASHYGLAGVEDIDYWFLKLESSIACSRYSIVRFLVDEMSITLTPLLHKIIQDSATETVSVTVEYADKALEPLAKFLDDRLSIISSSLENGMAQYLVYSIWRRNILYPLLNFLHPLPFYSEVSNGTTYSISSTSTTSTNGTNAVDSSNTNGSLKTNLNEKQIDMVKKCGKLLLDFFHADGEELGLDVGLLKNATGYIPNDTVESSKLGKLLFS